MLEIEHTILVIVDMQGKTLTQMHGRDELLAACKRLVRGLQVLGVPALRTELDPDHMGRTVADLTLLLPAGACVRKTSFSCCGEPLFLRALEAVERRQVILLGVETHIAVYQTARDLKLGGYDVHVAVDGVASRTARNETLGIDMMRHDGTQMTTVETALYELIGSCDHDAYRQIQKIVG